MKGDFTRNTFNPAKHFSRVLMQQGRVQVDADWNEQVSILLHYMRTVVADLVGPYAAPAQGGGFELVDGNNAKGDFGLTQGRIYVDGILVENNAPGASYLNQPALPHPSLLDESNSYGVYLDVWEEHVTALEDSSIREKALGGPDTATRAKVVWQVKTMQLSASKNLSAEERAKLTADLGTGQAKVQELNTALAHASGTAARNQIKKQIAEVQSQIDSIRAHLVASVPDDWCQQVAQFPRLSDAWLKARVEPTEASKDPCIQAPDAKYRGATNQLYRVEIQRGGKGQATGGEGVESNVATFKWSRDNGSVATRLIDVQAKQLTVQSARGFSPNAWVELSNDDLLMNGEPGSLVKLVTVEADTLTFDPSTNTGGHDLTEMTYVRRWDQQALGDSELADGAVRVTEEEWISLEDGIQVWFNAAGTYQSGDYWLIPARVIGGGIEWQTETDANGNDQPKAVHPQGIVHHYAPLGVIGFDGSAVHVTDRCRCEFLPINNCVRYGYDEGMGIGVDLLDI